MDHEGRAPGADKRSGRTPAVERSERSGKGRRVRKRKRREDVSREGTKRRVGEEECKEEEGGRRGQTRVKTWGEAVDKAREGRADSDAKGKAGDEWWRDSYGGHRRELRQVD